MTVLSGQTIRRLGLVSPCHDRSVYTYGEKTFTYGLGPAGYDLTIDWGDPDASYWLEPNQFRLAATCERFDMPNWVIGFVFDKSSWARRGLSLMNTAIEPAWRGFLTLELKNLSAERLLIPHGIPIAQVVFQRLDEPTELPYDGKYQNQEAGPQAAR